MRLFKNEKGCSLAELLIIIILLIAIWHICAALFCGNYWFRQEGVLKKIQVEHPNATKVIDSTINILDDSEIVVMQDGKPKTYYLDTNIFWNYKIQEK